ncbi:MAG: BamA/TamA family outer membrane protein, partial [Acidobacteria bacterium]|nr:BamA/TamA family outer membrane protein [Acidobacteriota bacterium]
LMLVVVHAFLTTALWSHVQDPKLAQPSTDQRALSGACDFGQKLEAIRFPGLSTADQQMLSQLSGLHPGETLEREKLQQAERAIFATGRFRDFEVDCDLSGPGQVVLTFPSSPNYFVGAIKLEGAPSRPTQSQIINASKLQLGELLSRDKTDSAEDNIRRLLRENGFYRVQVEHSEVYNSETHQVEITFRIHSGDPAHVGMITVKGNRLFSQGQIEDIAHLHPEDTVSAQTTSTAIDKIRKKYQQQDRWLIQVTIAAVEYREKVNAIDYTVVVDEGPIVEIRVEGFRMGKSTIRRTIPVYEENALDDDLLNEGKRNLLTYMESHGYFDANVELNRENAPNHNLVLYQIDPGQKHRVAKVEITGNQYFRADELRTGMQVQASSLVLPHGRFSQALVRSDLRDIENKYRANGFAEVRTEFTIEDDYRGVKNQLAIMIRISEGPQTLVGSFRIAGSLTQGRESLPPLNTQPNEPFSDFNVAQDRDIVLNFYFNNGYPEATFEASAEPAANHRMDVVFTIHEGERTYVDRVLVSGREYTRPYVIARELEMKTGDPLSQGDLLSTQQKLYDLGIFSQVDTAVQNPEGTEPRKNVLVQVRETRRYTFNYGGGFEFQTGQPAINGKSALGTTGVSPLASFDVTRLNFGGRDHTITWQSRVGRLQQRALLSYEAPRWLNNPNLKLTFTGFFDHTLDVATFTSQRLEGISQAEQVISRRGDGSASALLDYRFNYRLVKASNLEISPAQIPLLSQPVRVGEPALGYIRNHRDSDLETTRGNYITVDAGVAASYFGSQADFSRFLGQNSTYHPFGRQSKSTKQFVFARSTRLGLENAFANTVIVQPGAQTPLNRTLIPLPERFFMGGGNSHRGFGLNQAGPRDPITGFPTGGSALFLNNFEVRFPPPSLPFVEDNMSFAIFHDMGNVFSDGRHMLESLLRWHQDKQLCTQALNSSFQLGMGAGLCNYNYISHAIGVGVRYKTPVGPVRFDFGYNLNPTSYPGVIQLTANPATYQFVGTKQASPFNVYFSIGQTF